MVRKTTPPSGRTPSSNGHRKPLPDDQRHRRGSVARLPKQLRDQINNLLRDGLPYRVILEKLRATCPNPLLDAVKELHISRWRSRGGYREWLDQQEWRETMRAKQEDTLELLNGAETSKLHEVSLQLGAMCTIELLKRFEASAFSANLQDLPPGCLRLLAVLPRISREALRYQKYRDACAQARVELAPLRDPKRKLTDDERRAIVRNVDEILGLASPAPDSSDDGPTSNEAT